MGETQNLRTDRVDKYDPLYARYSRYIKTTDIISVGHKGTPPSATGPDWDMADYTVGDQYALFPYIFTVHSTNTAAQFIVLNNTTTALSLQVDSTGSQSIVTGCDCPLTRIAPGDEVKIIVPEHAIDNLTDTYAAFLISKREPIPSVVEN